MKRFLNKVFWFTALLAAVNIALVTLVPADENSYLKEYLHKVRLLESTHGKRIIFVGGSSVAFGNDSKTIGDSLGMPVVNFGLHAGIGIKYPLEDCLAYVHKGDVVVIQMEYANYFNGGNGEASTWALFMQATNWRRAHTLNSAQWQYVIRGVPRVAWGSLQRLVRYPLTGSLNLENAPDKFQYTRYGFNEWGDEVGHYKKAPATILQSGRNIGDSDVDDEFMRWLKRCVSEFEASGVKVVFLPPVCTWNYFRTAYSPKIEKAQQKIGKPFAASAQAMVLNDSCAFDGGYHVNHAGVRQNTQNIISALRPILNK